MENIIYSLIVKTYCMSPKLKSAVSSTSEEDKIEPIRIVNLFHLKYSARTYYVTINPMLVQSYELRAGDILKISIIEARKHRERVET